MTSPSPLVFHLCCEHFSFSEPLGPCVEHAAAWDLLRPHASGGMKSWSKVKVLWWPFLCACVGVTTVWVGIAKPTAVLQHLVRPQGRALMMQVKLLLQEAQWENFAQAPAILVNQQNLDARWGRPPWCLDRAGAQQTWRASKCRKQR